MSGSRQTPAGLAAALRLLSAARRRPDDADRPPPSTFAGKKVRLIPGQIDLYGGEHGAQPDAVVPERGGDD
jgi:hypothetical protein